MSRPIPSRKRAAPGASPIVPQPEQPQYVAAQPNQPTEDTYESYIDWSDPIFSLQGSSGVNQASYNTGAYPNAGFNSDINASNLAPPVPVQTAQNVGQLVKRNTSQQLARQERGQWEMGSVGAQSQPPNWEVDEDDAELEQQALEAKKDAQSKRKQIPPFVQKLSRLVPRSNCRGTF
jgi:heat shock transcription factor, other eukaryote